MASDDLIDVEAELAAMFAAELRKQIDTDILDSLCDIADGVVNTPYPPMWGEYKSE